MALEKCCCCCTLKTGTLVIATLGWIMTLMKIIGFAQSSSSYANNSGALAFEITYAVISFIACILLVTGVYKNKRYFMLPWLIIGCIECVVVSLASVAMFVFIFMAPSEAIGFIIAMFIIMALACALSWYLWVVVYSYFGQVRDQETGAANPSNIYYSPTSTNPPPYNKDQQSLA